MPNKFLPILLVGSLIAVPALAGTLRLEKETPKVETPINDEHWEFKLSLPAWISGIRGDEGLHGHTAHSVTGFNVLVNKIDMVAAFRFEVSKGRFGILGDFAYTSLSDGFGVGGLVRKADVQEDEILADLGFRWRLIEGPKGYLDFIAGSRYTNLHEGLKLQGDDSGINAAATRLAVLGTISRAALDTELARLIERDRSRNQGRFSRPSLTPDQIARLVRDFRSLNGTTAERADRIARRLHKVLNGSASRTDDWFDPYFGFRGRYNVTDKFYLLGRADISPFDVGSDFAWQASAGFGLQITRNISYEIVYRALSMEYRHDGLIFDTTTYGPEGTVSITF
jgi:hypothetical protein